MNIGATGKRRLAALTSSAVVLFVIGVAGPVNAQRAVLCEYGDACFDAGDRDGRTDSDRIESSSSDPAAARESRQPEFVEVIVEPEPPARRSEPLPEPAVTTRPGEGAVGELRGDFQEQAGK